MKIVHRIGFSNQKEFESDLIRFGIKYKIIPLPSGSYLVRFDIAETDSNWPQVQTWVSKIGASDIVKTIFTKGEIQKSRYLRIIPNYLWEYPQPETEWRNTIYNDWCRACGIGKQQKPFQVRREPKLGRKSFLSLFWAYPLLCTSRVLNLLESSKVSGFKRFPVVQKNGFPSKQIEQIFVTEVSNSPTVESTDLHETHCRECHMSKYLPVKRGMLRIYENALIPDLDMQSTYEYFGTGLEAYRQVIISNRLAKMMMEYKWSGLKIEPVKLVPSL